MFFPTSFFNIPDFPEYIKLFGYLGIFLFFITVDQITFIPEEITLLTIGYLSSHDVFNPFLAGFISCAAFVIVDTTYFYFTKKGVKFTEKLRKKRGRQFKRIEEQLKSNFPKTFLVLCFIPRMRMWAPIFSGALNIPIKRFLIYDIMSLILFTTTYISLGMIFHKGLSTLLSVVESVQHVIFACLVIVVGIIILINVRKHYKDGI